MFDIFEDMGRDPSNSDIFKDVIKITGHHHVTEEVSGHVM